jgi:hypothetical protein
MHLRPVATRYSWPAELDLMADRAGLRLAERYAGWDRQPFTSASSSHVSVYSEPDRNVVPAVAAPASMSRAIRKAVPGWLSSARCSPRQHTGP